MRVLIYFIILLVCISLVVDGWWWRRRRRRRRRRVNCQVTAWRSWRKCSKPCGHGITQRPRQIRVRAAHGGRGCPALVQRKGCNYQKCPINCIWGNWGPWANCTSCISGGRSRTRIVTRPAEFNGIPCVGSDVQLRYNSCPSQVHCPPPSCPANQFTCADGMSCVSKHLTCNKDNDCGDFSDERYCNKTWSPCGSRTYLNIPNADIAGHGYDIIKEKERGSFLDNNRFNGRCYTVRSGDHNTLFRKPFNIQSYNFQVSASTSFHVKSYQSAKSFFQDERSSFKKSHNVGASYLDSVFSLGLKTAGSGNGKLTKIVQWATDADTKIFRVYSDIELGHFIMNQPRNFIFSHQFQLLLRDLPKAYDYGKYEAVIRNFGTHYYSSGSLGGRYEYIYRYSKSALRQSGLTESQQQSCLSSEASIAFLGIGIGGGSSRCSSNSLSRKHARSFTNAATEVVSNVRGGTSGTAASLSFNSKSKKNFEAWVNSLKQNPAVVRYTVSPLSAVFNDVTKKLNMNRAIRFYLAKFDYAKCPSSCFNSGQLIVVNDGKVCKCLCAANFGGISCELRG